MNYAITLRGATAADAEDVARLMDQLGYPMDAAVVAERLAVLADDDSRMLVLACRGDAVVGWLEARIADALETGTEAEITGLIVDAASRGRGIGAILVERARAWASARGRTRLRVRTNVRRSDAAAFYANRGFHEIKQQRVFEMPIQTASPSGALAST